MKKIIFILNLVAVLGFFFWYINEPGWEPAIGTIVALTTFVSQFFLNSEIRRITRVKKMNQKAGNNSNQYQSGGTMTINSNTSPSRDTEGDSTVINSDSINVGEMSQEAGDDSTQYQSGGDMTIINDK